MKRGPCKGQRMEKRSSFDKRRSAHLGTFPPAGQETQRYIQRSWWIEEKETRPMRFAFQVCANIKPNNLKLFQEGIKATCYFEWLLNLLSCGEICNEIQPLQLIASCCNWTWQLRNIFRGFFWNSLEFFVSGRGCFWTLLSPCKLFYFKSERLTLISGILLSAFCAPGP